MNLLRKFFLLCTGSFALLGSVQAQSTPADKAQALLQEVKAREMDRQRDVQIREVERMNEDLEKGKKEVQDLQQSIEPTTTAIKDSTDRLEQFNARKRQLTKMLEVITLQIAAESLKVDGLKALSEAQAKSVLALSRRVEETEVRAAMAKSKLNPIARVQNNPTDQEVSAAGRNALELEKRLERAERATSTARSDAREAMTAATTQMQSANAADEKTKARAAELGIPIQRDLAPSQEAIEPLKEIDPLQTGSVPIALPVNK